MTDINTAGAITASDTGRKIATVFIILFLFVAIRCRNFHFVRWKIMFSEIRCRLNTAVGACVICVCVWMTRDTSADLIQSYKGIRDKFPWFVATCWGNLRLGLATRTLLDLKVRRPNSTLYRSVKGHSHIRCAASWSAALVKTLLVFFVSAAHQRAVLSDMGPNWRLLQQQR